jgi:RimJ/RimL family protein N-acetyltransferase
VIATNAGQSLLMALKETPQKPGAMLCIPVGSPVRAILRPVVSVAHEQNPEDVRRLTNWRNRFASSFLTEFEATEARTAKWLAEVVRPDLGKILFMVDHLDGETFGYMGLDFIDWEKLSAEPDAIVRGGPASPGTMTIALRTLLSWAVTQLGMKEINVRVLSDNTALEFYNKLGFSEVRRVGLRRVVEPDRVTWLEDPSLKNPQRSLVHMTLRDTELLFAR